MGFYRSTFGSLPFLAPVELIYQPTWRYRWERIFLTGSQLSALHALFECRSALPEGPPSKLFLTLRPPVKGQMNRGKGQEYLEIRMSHCYSVDAT
jgi:hypothetical protein